MALDAKEIASRIEAKAQNDAELDATVAVDVAFRMTDWLENPVCCPSETKISAPRARTDSGAS